MNDLKIIYPQYLKRLSDIFYAEGHSLYIVGGFIRDAIMGNVSDDIDICSDMKPDKVINILGDEDAFSATKSSLPLGTLIIRHKGVSIEYTAFRRESYRRDGTHTPSHVEFGATMEEDALRRDFACNSVYYDIYRDGIIDLLGGIKDIKLRILKTARDPEDVFSEDALRILRMARISAEIMFSPAAETLAGAKKLANTLKSLSRERITAEMQRLLSSDSKYPGSGEANILKGLEILFECGAAQVLFPEIRFEKSRVCARAKSYSVKAALFLYQCSDIKNSLDFICPNGETKKNVRFLLSHSQFDGGDALELLASQGYEKGRLLDEMLSVLQKKHPLLSRYLKNMEQVSYIISMKTLAISGRDITDTLDIPDSPEIGRIKKVLLRHIIEHPDDNKKEKLIDYIKKTFT